MALIIFGKGPHASFERFWKKNFVTSFPVLRHASVLEISHLLFVAGTLVNLKLVGHTKVWFPLITFGKGPHAGFERFLKKKIVTSFPVLRRPSVRAKKKKK